MNDIMDQPLEHHGIRGMKWGIRRFQPYQKGKKVKGGKEVGKAKSKREIRKENREAVRKKNNPTGISNRQLVKERVRIAKEEHKKAKNDIEKSINKELTDLAEFAKKNGLDMDDGGGGNNEKASREFQRRLTDLESRTYDMERTVNMRTSKRLIEEYGDTAVKRINDINKRKQMAVLAAPLAMSLGSVGLALITQSSLDDDILQHHGIRGMKWGIRRYQPYPSGKKGIFKGKKKEPGRIKKEAKSLKRELSSSKNLSQKNRDNLSDEELQRTVNRLRNENSLKKYAKRSEYLDREKLSDSDLQKRVNRLNLESQLQKEIGNANKDTIGFAKNVTKEIAGQALTSAALSGLSPSSQYIAKSVLTTIKNSNNKNEFSSNLSNNLKKNR